MQAVHFIDYVRSFRERTT